jgi:hypothetical protein
VRAGLVCHVCGVPMDADFFDESTIAEAPEQSGQVVLARFDLHPNYCGALLYFAQFTDRYANDPAQVETPGYQWEIRCSGQPRDPYLSFGHIINPWGLSGFPVHLRLEEGSRVELVVRNVGPDPEEELQRVGGRILGRFWYDTRYGGAPNRL